MISPLSAMATAVSLLIAVEVFQVGSEIEPPLQVSSTQAGAAARKHADQHDDHDLMAHIDSPQGGVTPGSTPRCHQMRDKQVTRIVISRTCSRSLATDNRLVGR